MPYISEVIERVDRAAENAWTEEEKVRWLMELDGKLLLEVAEGDAPPALWPEDGEKALLVPPPYDNLYDLYLFAMMDFHNREWDQYANSSAMFEAAAGEWRRAYRREHLPPHPGGYQNLL